MFLNSNIIENRSRKYIQNTKNSNGINTKPYGTTLCILP